MGPNPPFPLHVLANIVTGDATRLGIIGAALGFAGITLFIMLLVGGFRFITAGGDPKTAEAAKNTVTYAIAGMVLTACSFLIIRLIADFTGVNTITNFTIFR